MAFLQGSGVAAHLYSIISYHISRQDVSFSRLSAYLRRLLELCVCVIFARAGGISYRWVITDIPDVTRLLPGAHHFVAWRIDLTLVSGPSFATMHWNSSRRRVSTAPLLLSSHAVNKRPTMTSISARLIFETLAATSGAFTVVRGPLLRAQVGRQQPLVAASVALGGAGGGVDVRPRHSRQLFLSSVRLALRRSGEGRKRRSPPRAVSPSSLPHPLG